MKRLLTASLITLAIVVGALGAAPSAYAADDCATTKTQGASCSTSKGTGTCQNNEWDGWYCDVPAVATPSAGGATATPTDGKLGPPVPASYSTGGIMAFIASLFAWLLGVAVVTLDYAVYFTVVTMGTYVKDLTGVGIAWQVLRDIGNILLIFGFLAVGISIILNTERLGYGKKMLPMLLVAAVFLNFSLFITQAVIDVGNLFATQFYTQIKGGSLPQASYLGSTSFSQQIEKDGISNKLMSQMGLTSIYGDVRSEKAKELFESSALIGFMSIIIFMVAAFVFFSLAFILIARFVILLLLIILAPIGFAGLAVPKLESTAKLWWHNLFEQTITAPVLLLLLYIALLVITDVNFLTGLTSDGVKPNWTGSFTGDIAGFASVMLSFLIGMGLLLAVVIVSKKMSAFGAAGASKLAGMASFGAVSLGGRATLGGFGGLLASKRMQSWARKGGLGHIAKGAVLAGKGLRSATYDVRNIKGVTAGLGAIGVDAGKGSTWTPKQVIETDFGVKPVKKWFAESAAEREQSGREMDFRDAQNNIERIRNTYDGMGALSPAEILARDAELKPYEDTVRATVSKMSTKQLEELDGIKKGVDALVNNLSPQQFESLMKSDKLTEKEKDNVKSARYRAISSDAAKAIDSRLTPPERDAAMERVKTTLNSMSKGELESMPAELLVAQSTTTGERPILDQLSDKQRDTLMDSKERTTAERDMVRKSSRSGVVEEIFNTAGGGVAGATAVAGSPEFARLTVPQLAKLKIAILTQPAVAQKLTTATLIELQEQKKLTPAEMIDIGNHIRASATANAKTKDYVTTGPGAALWS